MKRFITKDDVDRYCLEYELAVTRLSQMRNPLSVSTNLEIQLQLQTTEALLQRWIEASARFTVTLNGGNIRAQL